MADKKVTKEIEAAVSAILRHHRYGQESGISHKAYMSACRLLAKTYPVISRRHGWSGKKRNLWFASPEGGKERSVPMIDSFDLAREGLITTESQREDRQRLRELHKLYLDVKILHLARGTVVDKLRNDLVGSYARSPEGAKPLIELLARRIKHKRTKGVEAREGTIKTEGRDINIREELRFISSYNPFLGEQLSNKLEVWRKFQVEAAESALSDKGKLKRNLAALGNVPGEIVLVGELVRSGASPKERFRIVKDFRKRVAGKEGAILKGEKKKPAPRPRIKRK